MSKALLLLSFFVAAPLILVFNILFISYLLFHKDPSASLALRFTPKNAVAYAALPSMENITTAEIIRMDVRVALVQEFLAQYSSPLEPFAKDIIAAADLYGIDFRLLPAIAMQESNLCKKAPDDSHNCWGFGIYGKKQKTFDNYPQAIAAVTKTLAQQYVANGLETPMEIMSKYTPSNDGAWARSVTHFMDRLQTTL